ncbi:MAG: nucleotidyltransferase family protein [Methylibium sp.]|nr:nucleotidyltransferase family protein [Methylibium sp.]
MAGSVAECRPHRARAAWQPGGQYARNHRGLRWSAGGCDPAQGDFGQRGVLSRRAPQADGDIDVLIPAHAYASVEAALLECGYGRLNHPAIDGHHHGAPLRHAARRTIVELHTVLFRSDSPLCERLLFSLPNVLRRSVRSLYHAMPVKRLSHELQLAYIASSWFNDLTQCKVHPSFVASLLDAVYLLSACRQTLQWKKMLEWLDNDMAKASLYTMVTYLPRYGVEPLSPADLALLASAQRLVGPIQLRMIHRMLDRHLIGGRPWNFAFPPPVPGRYSVSQQFRKKILSRLR